MAGMSKEERVEAKRAKKAEKEAMKSRTFENYPVLLSIKPKEKYVFHSDYFVVDGRYGSILSFFHMDGAQDNYGPFWGVNRVPSGLDKDIEVTLFEQSRRMTEDWISSHQASAEGIFEMDQNEGSKAGAMMKNKANRKVEDVTEIAKALTDGGSYLHVTFRLMVMAPTLEKLDDALGKISRLYIDRFGTSYAAPYFGEQRRELSNLFVNNDKKLGKGMYFTSEEYAGAYSLVTHGMEDKDGEYIGYMVGDVNNAAVLFSTNGYRHHVVVGEESYVTMKGVRTHASALWGSKLSQSCMLHNGRVVHLILDGTNLDLVGPRFDSLTFRLDLNKGDVNMFEIFGDRKDQLSLFSAQMQKLILMAEQAYETTDSDRSVIRGSLEEIATRYYIDQRMWYENAGENQDRLRIVGIPHNEVPKLDMFCSYLDMEYKSLVNKSARDEEKLHALSVLSLAFRNMLSNNGDLFNTITSDAIDGARTGRRVIYDFSSLMYRGAGVAMAQLVNIMGFAVNTLGFGDTVIIHGAENIADGVKDYINLQLSHLYDAGGRVVYIYNDINKMLEDKAFCQYDKPDYIVLGTMPKPSLDLYQERIGQKVPSDLSKLVTNAASQATYIRRGYDNVVFKRELSLGLKKGR